MASQSASVTVEEMALACSISVALAPMTCRLLIAPVASSKHTWLS